LTQRSARAGRRQTARSNLLMYLVHLGRRLKAPRKAAGQMDLLTVPSLDSVDSKVIQVEEGFISLLSRPLRPILIPQRQTRASSPVRDAHGVMPNSRHVPSRQGEGVGQREREKNCFAHSHPIFASLVGT
jgi:hypothetical protein